MPVVIPAIAGFASSTFLAGAGLGAISTFAATTMGGLVVGAVTGAVVGGIQSAIMGGDIGEGILYGAVGGAVGGALGGYLAAPEFASAGITGGDGISTGMGIDAYQAAGVEFMGTEGVGGGIGVEGTIGTSSKTAGTLTGLSEGAESALVQGGMGLLSGFGGEEGLSLEEQKEMEKFATDQRIREIEASKGNFAPNPALAVAKLQTEQSQREALLSAELAREQMAEDAANLKSQLAMREKELEKPYEEEAEKRARIRETAQGFLVKRQSSEGQSSTTSGTSILDDTPEYVA